MKTNLNFKNMSKSVNNFISEYNIFIETYKEGLSNEIIKSNEDILNKISIDYNLDYKELEKKYLKDIKVKCRNKNLIDSDDNDSDIDLSFLKFIYIYKIIY